eukprot:CAMPEP_0204511414 /NCGR_PEP_ID=MMETSP0661-20131031/416_1 /ASSEMBLY_ACC=CAM_ASM_000606 /TAXON_ID=109239 /ORGANISM="Alexandrium margalefi, Strain AMGDE01CS-322" /LENGTH=184 /DNA_ID=CAMNT_0051516497 /DNA_START=39 /DNA_END=593 /DNA_ORIENTATION=+
MTSAVPGAMAGACQEYLRGARAGLSFWCVGLYLSQITLIAKIGLGGVIWALIHAGLGGVVLAMCVESEDLSGLPLVSRLDGLLQWGKDFTMRRLGKRMQRPSYYGLLAFYLGFISISRAFKDRTGQFIDDIWVGYVALSFVTANVSIAAWFLGKCCGCLCGCCGGSKKEEAKEEATEETNKKDD